MKHELKMCVIGARFTASLVALTMIGVGVALFREYPAAVAAGLAMWAVGNALVFAADWYLRRLSALRRAEKRNL